MNYELAKELKDVGFPDSESWVFIDKEKYNYPSLSELIEACGDRFYLLRKEKDVSKGDMFWRAMTHDNYGGTGETIEIAVAKLYIALNKK